MRTGTLQGSLVDGSSFGHAAGLIHSKHPNTIETGRPWPAFRMVVLVRGFPGSELSSEMLLHEGVRDKIFRRVIYVYIYMSNIVPWGASDRVVYL